jgi:hypothetical protein
MSAAYASGVVAVARSFGVTGPAYTLPNAIQALRSISAALATKARTCFGYAAATWHVVQTSVCPETLYRRVINTGRLMSCAPHARGTANCLAGRGAI